MKSGASGGTVDLERPKLQIRATTPSTIGDRDHWRVCLAKRRGGRAWF